MITKNRKLFFSFLSIQPNVCGTTQNVMPREMTTLGWPIHGLKLHARQVYDPAASYVILRCKTCSSVHTPYGHMYSFQRCASVSGD